jgi:long-chain acyl-CoA synthetase
VAGSFVHRLEAAARRAPEKTALLWNGGALTHAELQRRADAFAERLRERGVSAGERIALTLPNHWTFAVALLGGWKVGATVAPLDRLLKGDERAAILADLAPKLIVASSDVAAVEREASAGSGAAASGIDETRSLQPATDPGRPDGAQPQPGRQPRGSETPGASAHAPALILYTSGSTGRPKGAVLSHEALAFANESWAGPVMALTPADIVLAVLPLAHSFGLNGALLAPLLAGASVVLVERFSPEAAQEAIRHHGVTVFPGVATMFHRLLESPALAAADLSSLRLAVSGAAPCPWELAEEWRRRTGARILRGYGMTELFRPISCLAGDAAQSPESIGRAVPGVEVRAVDDAGRALPAGEVGELWIKSPAAMQGYLNDPQETREVLRPDGWFRTGDLATISAGGEVRIAGRKRERILRGGHSVFPQEVEAVLLTHPAVVEAAVVGVPHSELGEEVTAFVALRPGAGARADELVLYCRQRLAAFKYPRQVTIVDALPRSATGKIIKSSLRGPS